MITHDMGVVAGVADKITVMYAGYLVASAPDRFFRPPYVGGSGWVGVVLDDKPDWKLVESLVRDAFIHVAKKKLLDQL